ncbi:MAG: hypothetical protein LBP87_11670 [Planctomycetaceae bacterium]|jgi:hypothetical protein|nr:hypothetical protein [Planctomycetaceae bacterium]
MSANSTQVIHSTQLIPENPAEMLDRQINETRRFIRHIDLFLSFFSLLTILLAVLFAAVLADHWFFTDGLSMPLRFGFFTVLLVIIAFYIYRRIVPLLLYPINPVYAARLLEESTPSLKNSIVNWILLRKERLEQENYYNNKLAERMFDGVTQTAVSSVNKISSEQAVDLRGFTRWGIALTLCCLLFVVYALFSPKNPFTSLVRIILPVSNIERPQAVRFLNIEPGNTIALQGEKLTVSAEVVGQSKEPVYLFFSTDDGQFVRQAIPMSLPEGKTRYEVLFPPGKQGFSSGVDYWIAQDDSRSGIFRINVRPTASVEIVSLKYHFPPYTGLPDETVENSGDIRAVEGTEVKIDVRSTIPLQRIDILFDNDPVRVVGMKLSENNPLEATATIILKPDPQNNNTTTIRNFLFRATDLEGYESRRSGIFRLEVLPDQPPKVQWADTDTKLKDVAQLDVPLNRVLEFPIQAEDHDFGLRYLRFHIESGNKQIRPVELLKSPATGPTEYKGSIQRKAVFSPITSRLAEGDSAEIWAEAVDTKFPNPNNATTRRITVRITAPQKQEQQENKQNSDENKDNENKNNKENQNKELNKQNENKEQQEKNQDSQENTDNREQNDEPSEKTENDTENKGENNQENDKENGEEQGSENNGTKDNQQKSDDTQNNQNEREENETEQGNESGEQNNSDTNENMSGNKNTDNNKTDSAENDSGNSGKENSEQKNEQKNNDLSSKNDRQNNSSKKHVNPETQDGDAMEEILKQMKKEGKFNDKKQDNNSNNNNNNDEQNNNNQNDNNQNNNDNQNNNQNNAGQDADNQNHNSQKNNEQTSNQKENQNENETDSKSADSSKQADSMTDSKSEQQNQNGQDSEKQGQSDAKQENSQLNETNKTDTKNNKQTNNDSINSEQTNSNDKEHSEDLNNNSETGNDNNRQEKSTTESSKKPENNSQSVEQSVDDVQDTPVDPADKTPRQRDDSLDPNSKECSNQGNDSSKPKKSDTVTPDNSASGEEAGKNQKTGQQKQNDQTQSSQQNQTTNENENKNENKNEIEKQNETTKNNPSDENSNQQHNPNQSDLPKSENSASGKNQPNNQSNNQSKQSNNQPNNQPSNQSGNQMSKQPQDSASNILPNGGQGASASNIETPPEDPNLEYTKKITNLVLEYLEDQLKTKPNQELLNNLGWTEKELRDFYQKWQEMSEQSKSTEINTANDNAKWKEAFKSLGLKPAQDRQQLQKSRTEIQDKNKVTESQRFTPPSAIKERFKQYTEGIGK